jgi:hypothetical protein
MWLTHGETRNFQKFCPCSANLLHWNPQDGATSIPFAVAEVTELDWFGCRDWETSKVESIMWCCPILPLFLSSLFPYFSSLQNKQIRSVLLPGMDLQHQLSRVSEWGSDSQSYFTTGGLSPISSSWRQTPWDLRPKIFFQLNPCGYKPYATSSLMRGCVCRLQLLLVLASAVILGSESSRTHTHILLSQIRDSPNMEGQVPVFISPGTQWSSYTPLY